MREYISNYGFHFSKRAFNFATRQMRGRDGEKMDPVSKEQVDEILQNYGIELKNRYGYDAAYVYNMARSDFYKSSLPDEQHLALFVRDTIDDHDASEETTFRRWLATMVGNGVGIDWEDLI